MSTERARVITRACSFLRYLGSGCNNREFRRRRRSTPSYTAGSLGWEQSPGIHGYSGKPVGHFSPSAPDRSPSAASRCWNSPTISDSAAPWTTSDIGELPRPAQRRRAQGAPARTMRPSSDGRPDRCWRSPRASMKSRSAGLRLQYRRGYGLAETSVVPSVCSCLASRFP